MYFGKNRVAMYRQIPVPHLLQSKIERQLRLPNRATEKCLIEERGLNNYDKRTDQ